MEILEPKHFLRICVSRELTDVEFEDMTDIVDDEIGDIVASDDVIEHNNEAGMILSLIHISEPTRPY